jgi:hypothetical protein
MDCSGGENKYADQQGDDGGAENGDPGRVVAT